MCFSATASFGASAVLIPVGIYCVKQAGSLKQPYWVFAILPLVFGIQQIFEGFVWLALDPHGGGAVRMPALGFMLFSHVFWLIWIPFACYALEYKTRRKKLFFALIFFGAGLGLSMYVPLWLHEDWLTVLVTQQSIDYKTILLYDDYVPRMALRVIYALIVLIPLLLASDHQVNIFGVIIAVSVAISSVFYGYAFISVWCYFAALLSFYIVFMLHRKTQTA
jgi:hypothetical protein